MAKSVRKIMKKSRTPPKFPGRGNLFLAAMLDDTQMYHEAIADGQQVNATHPRSGKTPLHVAACYGSLQVGTLISMNPAADPWAYDSVGRLAFDYAAMRKDTEMKGMLSRLMDAKLGSPAPGM